MFSPEVRQRPAFGPLIPSQLKPESANLNA
jgi:hypothetical protein